MGSTADASCESAGMMAEPSVVAIVDIVALSVSSWSANVLELRSAACAAVPFLSSASALAAMPAAPPLMSAAPTCACFPNRSYSSVALLISLEPLAVVSGSFASAPCSTSMAVGMPTNLPCASVSDTPSVASAFCAVVEGDVRPVRTVPTVVMARVPVPTTGSSSRTVASTSFRPMPEPASFGWSRCIMPASVSVPMPSCDCAANSSVASLAACEVPWW
jgi:hypothetical protein